MNIKILLIALSAAAISSCSTTYRSGQTPDDVYFSPTRPGEETRTRDREETRNVHRQNADPEIVMGIYDSRWRNFGDDYNYYYDPYHYGYTYGYYYNPYYYPCPVYVSGAAILNPKNTVPRMTNLGSYNYSNMVVVNSKSGSTNLVRSTRIYNNSNRDNNFIRRIITPAYIAPRNNSYEPTDNNTRTYSPSTNNSSSGSSSSGKSSGTPVARPGRGG